MISKIALAVAILPILILNNSMIAIAFTASITPNILVQKKTPENLAAKALYYAENASTFGNHPEYQKELNKAKKLILSLPNSEAKQNLIRALAIHIVVDYLFDCASSDLDFQNQKECTLNGLLKITEISHFANQTVKQAKEGIPVSIDFITIKPRLIEDAIKWRKSVLPRI
ncbi:MAG: hypothetical protein F6K54_23610 [Okeania sp. SIO3B5]|uniref:hypothetical protein n=1 Tax=Okeania sp. SIO3B5 TaxID=2607811 RepID=UPI0013FF2B49|nr:hypothetical protein [Okeania sp. SIO3B5]NEO55792.1 hypothetical protein [Okeania sp. SIO3B5]